MHRKKDINLSMLTVVIVSYNRQAYLLRSIKYWERYNCKLIIIDGTKDILVDLNKHIQSKNIKYINCIGSYTDRLKLSLDFIETEYCVLLGDDEFFLVDGLIQSIKNINENNYICAMGRPLLFYFKKDELSFEEWVPNGVNFRNYKIIDENYRNRIKQHMSNYLCSTIYAVFKTDNWVKCMTCATFETPFADSIELGFELAASYLGKSIVIDALYWFRSAENEPIYNIEIRNKIAKPQIHEIIHEKKYISELQKFCKNIAEFLDNSDSNLTSELMFGLEEYARIANARQH